VTQQQGAVERGEASIQFAYPLSSAASTFGAVVLVVAGVLSWVTVRTLGLERSERAAAGEASRQRALALGARD
jgi:predicted metal-binding membrane protein